MKNNICSVKMGWDQKILLQMYGCHWDGASIANNLTMRVHGGSDHLCNIYKPGIGWNCVFSIES